MWSNKREFCRNSEIFPHSNKSVKRLILNLLASKLQNQFVSYKGNLLESAQSFLRKQERNMTSAGHRKFFFKSANPQPNFNFLNPQPQVRNWTFKSLVRNRKSAMTFRDS